MSFFIEDALAEGGAAAAQAPDVVSQLMVFGGIFLIFYLLFIRPQNKKIKEHKEMVEALSKGDEVVTNGGLLGKVVAYMIALLPSRWHGTLPSMCNELRLRRFSLKGRLKVSKTKTFQVFDGLKSGKQPPFEWL